jgi:hypothetical protein
VKGTKLWVEMVCIECASSGYGQWISGSSIPVRTFQLEAKERGWRQRTDGEFECPQCTRKMLREVERLTGIELNKEPTP